MSTHHSFVEKSHPFKSSHSPKRFHEENPSYHYKTEVPVNIQHNLSSIPPPRVYEQYPIIGTPHPYDTRNMITKTSLVQTPLIEKKSVIVNGPPISQIVPPTSPPRYETRSLIINPGKPPLIPNQTIIRSASPSPRRSAREFENDLNTKLKMEIDRLCFVLQQKEEELNSFKAKCAHLEGHLSSPHQSPRNLSRLQVKKIPSFLKNNL